MPDPTDPRRWLRTHRARHDQTQSEAAEVVGVSRHTFARWEAGDLLPGLEQAVALADWADCSVDDVALAFGLDVPKSDTAEVPRGAAL